MSKQTLVAVISISSLLGLAITTYFVGLNVLFIVILVGAVLSGAFVFFDVSVTYK